MIHYSGKALNVQLPSFQIKKCHRCANLKMDLLTTKIVTMSILGLVSLLVGFIPMLVAKKVSWKPTPKKVDGAGPFENEYEWMEPSG